HPGRFRNVFDLRGYRVVTAAARRLKPDWLVGDFGKEYWPLILLGRLLRMPVALFRHRIKPMKGYSARLVPRLAQRFFAVSEYARRDYIERGMPAPRVQVLYNPVDTDSCRPDATQRSALLHVLGLDENAIVLGYTGRMLAWKGIFPLLEAVNMAMAREPRLQCIWLGDGTDAQRLQERIAVLPLAHRHQVLGWVEAQACNVPVLVSDVGGIPETLQPGATGLLLPPGDVDAWCEAILALCDDATRRPMAAAARDFAERRFSSSVIAAEFVRQLGDAKR